MRIESRVINELHGRSINLWDYPGWLYSSPEYYPNVLTNPRLQLDPYEDKHVLYLISGFLTIPLLQVDNYINGGAPEELELSLGIPLYVNGILET